jgi:arginyl-tRNA synthetase
MRARETLEAELGTAVQVLGFTWPEKVSVEPPREDKFGDMATNVAMLLAREARKNPRGVAEDVKQELLERVPELESVDVAGPGFLNFTFKPSFWQQGLLAIQREAGRFGALTRTSPKRVLIEYVSANPTGPLHIGHGRGAAVGDSLARIMRFAGFDVATEYYLNDAGRQMQLLGRSIWIRYQQICGREAALPQDCYQGAYIQEIASRLYQDHGTGLLDMGDQAAKDLCLQTGMNDILDGIKQDLARFRTEHEIWFSEQSLFSSGQVEATLRSLEEKGLAYEQDGALWFRSSAYGDDKDRVMRKSDGELTYFASDIAYHADKFSRGFDLLIDVWGADHHGYVPRMKAAVSALDRDPADFQVVLIQLVNLLRDGVQVAMSTRAGQFETLDDVCEEVGVDAARFIFLSRKSDSPLDFDLELLKAQSMDNPVYYVQYAHARICSVLRKAQERGQSCPEASREMLSRLDTREDLELLKKLDRFPEAVEGAARTLSPHHVSTYLQETAGLLHRYYNRHQILNGDDELTVQARLHLIKGVAIVLKNGLNLLGVTAPQSM